MPNNSRHFYDFGPYRVDASERLLLRGEDVVPLTPKAFEMLLVLLESSGHVLTKEELMKRVWPDTIVEEANLSHNVYKLRDALGEGRDGGKYIETLPRRGYRFVAKVTEVQDRSDDLIVEQHSRARIVVEEDDTPENVIDARLARAEQRGALPSAVEARHFSIPKPGLMVIAGTVLIGLVVGAVYFWRARQSASVNVPALHSIAVLPFKPLAANDRDESLEMGMAETLITRLSHIGQLTVRPSSAVRQYTKLEDEAVKAGRELRVDAVLDGSIQKSGDRIRVSVRLVRVEQGQTLWIEQFDEKFSDIFTVQDAISRRVAGMLALRLSGEEKERLAKRGTDNLEAYQAYLLGRFHWNKLTEADVIKSIDYFNQALARDPNYALAYAGLADSYIALPTIGNTPSSEANIKAREAALQSLAIDDTIAEAHTALATIKELYEWDFVGAEREFKRAIEFNPNYTTSHSWYSQFLSSVGRYAEAIAEAKRALEVDPTSLYANVALGNTYLDARQPDEAIVQLQRTIDMDKNFALAHLTLAEAYRAKERYEDAIAEVTKSMVLSGRNSTEQAARKANMLRDGYHKSGAKGYWEKNLELRIENMKRGYTISPTVMAEAYARTGDKDRAFEWLEKAYTDRDQYLFYNLKPADHFDGIRSDPRYQKLLQRIGLPQ
jgi:DNA-binding winged helix-turn-helix (wHTH) protein/TolB-like protein/predicted negative regulator of RcsB-dependent stress response